ncbi:DUF2339 domain-containing protein [Schlegelella sp. S2-27]|uniref:DUF2339 domain-containing protein n=1 Tax=Caldimonas mangrovi TaxID=2944811 RepID=A0ABT0YH35_9BURK|nr:DUF2339 domain-containing protein [Caldimonas mangrovi]MCM5678037.1 DUF2339 domain-containing protein [Caldimonas mangrovi]
MSWIGLIVGLALAWVLADWFGAGGGLVALGGLMGVLIARLFHRVGILEAELAQLKRAPEQVGAPAAAPDAPAAALPASPGAPVAVEPPQAPAEPGFEDWNEPAATPLPAPVAAPPPRTVTPALEPDEYSPAVTTSLGRSALAWFRGGNTIVRIGVLILFLGVAFLLRYAAEHALLPIELRLAGVALGGGVLAVIGWRLRDKRRGYGLTLQGAGVGVLYLTIFAAFRLYGLVPAGLAFALLAALSAAAAVLAVVQNALPLAVLGFSGDFLAPVFASTGQGSHVALFSYYLVLNLAIAWIASRQTWKLLNLVGFFFTFTIASLWGARSWQPEYFATTEPFLIAHFVLYLFISVQYSRQLVGERTPQGLPYVDGGLLFGLPIVAFGLQAALVKEMPYALALSSAVLSGVYLVLGRWLWRHSGQQLRLLIEGLLALGVIFLVLVTPLALDARWTGAAWAVQGAGIVWIGLRQGRLWATGMGLLLQCVAAAMFWDHPARLAEQALIVNAALLSALLLGGSALVSAKLLQAHPALPAGAVQPLWNRLPSQAWAAAHWFMLGLGLLQVLGGVGEELDAVAWPSLDTSWRTAMLFAVAGLMLEALHRRVMWPELRLPARVLWLLAAAASITGMLGTLFNPSQPWERYFDGYGWLELVAVLAVGVWLLRRLQAAGWLHHATGFEHAALAWYAMAHGAVLLYAVAGTAIGRHEAWTALAPVLLPTAVAWWLLAAAARGAWPAAPHPGAYRHAVLLPWALLLLTWSAFVNGYSDAGMAPLPYLPLINPIDLGHALGLLFGIRLWRVLGGSSARWGRPLAVLTLAAAFWWLNSALVRILHHWAGTPMWDAGALDSDLVQMSLTILWTVTALLTMLWATRRAGRASARTVWLAGAVLLGAVVLKLFFVDLSHLGTLQRIVSFLGVGLLMLVIGYVSPLPPAAPTSESRA